MRPNYTHPFLGLRAKARVKVSSCSRPSGVGRNEDNNPERVENREWKKTTVEEGNIIRYSAGTAGTPGTLVAAWTFPLSWCSLLNWYSVNLAIAYNTISSLLNINIR